MRALPITMMLLAYGAAGCSLALDWAGLEGGSAADTEEAACLDGGDCDDGITCTVDACNVDGTCRHDADNDLCARFERCDPVAGCQATGDECFVAADCDDGVDCTIDSCLLGPTTRCRHTADDDACDDPDPCVINERCDAAAGCVAGTEMPCPPVDGVCLENRCDSASGECAVRPLAGGDDDSDSAYDELCGGDDCDDLNGDVHPGQAEACDGRDNDCDGATDLALLHAPVELAGGAGFGAAAVACDAERCLVAWQAGDGLEADVLVRLVEADGAAGDPMSLGALAEAALARPAVVATPAGFAVAAEVAADGALLLVGVESAPAAGEPEPLGEPEKLTRAGAAGLARPVLVHDGAALALWATAVWPDATASLELWWGASSPLAHAQSFDRRAGAIDSLAVQALGAAWHLVAVARADTATDDDPELFVATASETGGLWALDAGGFARISAADPAAADASTQPSIHAHGASRVIAYTDEDGGDEDILARADGGTVALAADALYDHRTPRIAALGDGHLLVSRLDAGSTAVLETRLFDADLVAVDDGRSSLASGAFGAFDVTTVSSSILAAAWVEDPEATARLVFVRFAACLPANP